MAALVLVKGVAGPAVSPSEAPDLSGVDQIALDVIGYKLVPLPAGAWMGLSLLVGMGVVGSIRRKRRAHRPI